MPQVPPLRPDRPISLPDLSPRPADDLSPGQIGARPDAGPTRASGADRMDVPEEAVQPSPEQRGRAGDPDEIAAAETPDVPNRHWSGGAPGSGGPGG
jgi:hypothetical protein